MTIIRYSIFCHLNKEKKHLNIYGTFDQATEGNDTSDKSSNEDHSSVDMESTINVPQVESNRLKGHFCSDVVFHLSGKVLTDLEIKSIRERPRLCAYAFFYQ